LTANDDSQLQGPLRDRLRIVRMPEPRREDLPTLARAMVSDMARERGGNPAWWPHLNEDELEIAGRLWLGGSVRRLRFIVERLLAAREKNARN
jgi:DNA-binding NtrC family response regulator